VCHWHPGTDPTVNFLTFGTIGAVDVRVTRIGGSIDSIDVSPHSKNIPVQLSAGKAVLTLSPNNKAWITVNGDDANPLFVFADSPKPPVPAGATYVGPGILDIPSPGNHYKPANNEIIYLDGGAWVRGNVDLRGTTGVLIMGPGVLSGDLWVGEAVNGLPFDQFLDYTMIEGDWFGGNAARVQEITIVDSPGYNFFSGATNAIGVKILSPWFFSTDGFQGVSHVDQSFVFNGDNAFAPGAAGVQNDDVTITSSFGGTTNNSVFSGGYWGFESDPAYTALADDIDVKTYNNDDWVPPAPLLASVFQVWMDNDDSAAGYRSQTYQNIRIEGDLAGPMLLLENKVYPFGGPYVFDPPLGNGYNFVFRNVSLEGTQAYLSEIKGWDPSNGFHGVVLDNVQVDGTIVTPSNLASYFDVNGYVWGLDFAAVDVTSISPASGPASGVSGVVVGGANFAAGASATVGGIAASNVVVDDSGQITLDVPALSPGVVHAVSVTNPSFSAGTLADGWFADFMDVPGGSVFHPFVEKLVRHTITAGCGGGSYCPSSSVTRAQMAVFLLRSHDGPGYMPPPCVVATFADVPCSSGFAPWVNELAARGITAGCGGDDYCPSNPVTRAQMAVFLLRTHDGSAYVPPACDVPTFPDVPCSSGYAPWVDELAARGITAGCGGGNYCPDNPVTRGQMAVFLVTTFALP